MNVVTAYHDPVPSNLQRAVSDRGGYYACNRPLGKEQGGAPGRPAAHLSRPSSPAPATNRLTHLPG
jgi:hypothetical protein